MSPQAIICLDDERYILSGLQQQIQQEFGERFLLEFAMSGDEALEIIEMLNEQSIEIPIVFTDEMMPGIKGHELIAELGKIAPKTQCVLLTGYADSEVLKSLGLNASVRCLQKPWERSEIVALVQQVCGPAN